MNGQKQTPLVVVNPIYQGPKYAQYTNNIAAKLVESLNGEGRIKAVHILNLCKDYHGKTPEGRPYPAIVKNKSIMGLDNREGVDFIFSISVRKRDSPINRGIQVEYGSLEEEARMLAAISQRMFDKNPAIISRAKVYGHDDLLGNRADISVYNVVGTRVAHSEQLIHMHPLSKMRNEIRAVLETQRDGKYISQMQFQRAMNAISQLVGEYKEGKYDERLSVLVVRIIEEQIENQNDRPLKVKSNIREIARTYGNASTLFVKNHKGYLKSVSYVLGNPNSQYDRLVMESQQGIATHSQAAADFLYTVTGKN